MAIILNPSFETTANWTLGRSGYPFDTPTYETYYAHAGSKSLLLRLGCGDIPTGGGNCYARQSITVQNNHYISFWIKTNGDSGHLDGHGLYFRVLFDGNVVYSSNDYTAITASMPLYRCASPTGWNDEDYYEGQIVNVNLSSYVGQTGNIEFQLYHEVDLDHLYDTRVFVDDITESYNAIADYYVKVGGNDSLSGTTWANAWATVNKAATTVADGSTVHIEYGTYNAEPGANKIAPQNVGTSGIYYSPEGGTSPHIVSVQQNT